MSRVTGQQHHLAVRDRNRARMWWFEFTFAWRVIGLAANDAKTAHPTPARVAGEVVEGE